MGVLVGRKGILLALLLLLAASVAKQCSDLPPPCPALRDYRARGSNAKTTTQSWRKAVTKVCGCTGIRTCLACELHHGRKFGTGTTISYPRSIASRWYREDQGGFRRLEFCVACGLCEFPPELSMQHAAVRSVRHDATTRHQRAFVSWYTQETGTCSGELCCGELREEGSAPTQRGKEGRGSEGGKEGAALRTGKEEERGVRSAERRSAGAREGGSAEEEQGLWRDLATAFSLNGLTLIPDLLSPSLESDLLACVEAAGWGASQSGRRKLECGPKVNFKEQSIRVNASYATLPLWSLPLLQAIESSSHPALAAFVAVELGALEYEPLRGAAIAPHIDDSWLWGDRIVTCSLLSAVTMGFLRGDVEVRVQLPPRSALVMAGPARSQWLHAIRRQDVSSRRVSLTMRELSAEFSQGGAREEEGQRVIAVARSLVALPPRSRDQRQR